MTSHSIFKVTYLPEGYIKDYRRSHNLRPELTLMKQMARQLHVTFEKSNESVLMPDLWRKLDDHPHGNASALISELQDYRESLLNDSVTDPKMLVQWLYEHQGARRFDASIRLFLVLVDKRDFFGSWKLKRARPLIAETVNRRLNDQSRGLGFHIDFNWEGSTYSTESDVIFVVK